MTDPTLDDARRVLRRSFGYDAFRAGQELAVTAVLERRDTLVILPTGGGKSVCYQVPALLLPGLTVVVSPLISLMKDQVDALNARGLPAAFINSTLSSGQVSDRLAAAQRGELKLLYVAPERFDQGSTAERLRKMGVSLLAVDEAHCVSEWGHDFRPSYLRIHDVRQQLGNPPAVALTATATPEVRQDIARQLRLVNPVTVITGFDRQNLHYHVIPTRNDDEKRTAMIRALSDRDGVAVVYASTRRAVEQITGVLERAHLPVVGYHAGLDDARRHEVQEAFMQERVRVIVATNAFGMGIDKANVRLVIHYSMPGTLEAYYQEAGRAGRDGARSDCILLHSFPDRFTHEFFIRSAYPERSLVEQVYARLRHEADRTGLVTTSARDLLPVLSGKVSEREVESALRLLAQSGALATESEAATRVHVRLLATPDRIRRELRPDQGMELELLRALWRGVGKSISQGALVDVDGLPPGFGGAQGVFPLLDSLQARQFVAWERTGGGNRLTRPASALSVFRVDWAGIDRRRRAELSKLDAVQRYAYTDGCRRAFVLRYFGDAAAGSRCTGCDNCLGIRHKVEGTGTAARRRKDERRRVSRTARSATATSVSSDPVVGPDEAPLFSALKTLRSELARAQKVPAYVVFSDRTLAEMALRRPRTLTGMGDISGVGPTKLDRYGERFLDVIRAASDIEAA